MNFMDEDDAKGTSGEVRLMHEDSIKHHAELWDNLCRPKDLEMTVKGGFKVLSSTLLMSICSEVVQEAVGDIFKSRELDLTDKMAVILPDFSKEAADNLLCYVFGKGVTFKSESERDELIKLLKTLRIKHQDSFKHDLFQVDVKVEPEDSILPSAESESDVKRTECQEDVKSKIRKKRGRPKGPKFEEGKPMPRVDRVIVRRDKIGPRSKPKRPSWHIGLTPPEDDEQEVKTRITCGNCDVDCSTLQLAIDHLKSLTIGWGVIDFRQKAVFRDGLFKCPICHEHKFKLRSEATLHVQAHIQEFHDNVTSCTRCRRPKEYQDV